MPEVRTPGVSQILCLVMKLVGCQLSIGAKPVRISFSIKIMSYVLHKLDICLPSAVALFIVTTLP